MEGKQKARNSVWFLGKSKYLGTEATLIKHAV